ncbi:hypothetical protein PMAYCL1PPCAC_30891 [Pristionchus mayeri]|uniref:BTB domain-containing protein n=1 Tax=Pristionchus mayeri TaxID=1317129 RepID=A0AAN5DBZ7_9BILA|nr:hypothetical protein PMAYCL1PPCAC_30891 [Pristionchus mayeri]
MVPPFKKIKQEDPALVAMRTMHEYLTIAFPKTRMVSNLAVVAPDIKGFRWTVTCESIVDIDSMDDEAYLSFTVKNHMNDDCDAWYCDTTLTLLIPHINQSKCKFRVLPYRFSPTDDKFTFHNIINTDDFLADSGYFKDDEPCNISIRIEVNSVDGKKFFKRQHIDWSEETTGSDVCLVVEGKKFFVGKHFLVRHATFFGSMFYGGFKEQKMEEIELKDVDKHYFEMFLNYLHNFNGQKIDSNNVWQLLDLADRYDCQAMMLGCEKFIMETREYSHAERFLLADKYRLYALKDRCFSQLVNADQITDLIKSPFYKELDKETQDVLTMKLADLYDVRRGMPYNPQMNQYLGPSYNGPFNAWSGPSTSSYQPQPVFTSRPSNSSSYAPYNQPPPPMNFGGPGPSRPMMGSGMNSMNPIAAPPGFSNNPGPSNYNPFPAAPPAPVIPPPPARKAAVRKPRQTKAQIAAAVAAAAFGQLAVGSSS